MASTHSQVQLFFKCNKLFDGDSFSKSDPYVLVKDETSKSIVGRTEVVKNNLNPEFKTAVLINFFFEMKQDLVFEVWDKDTKNSDDSLGSARCTLGSIMSSLGSSATLNLSKKGTITVTAVPLGTKKGTVSLCFIGKNLKKMDTFSKSDPYFILSRQLPNGQKKQVFKSEVIDNTLNPQWKATPALDLMDLCGGDLLTPCIAFDCFDEDNTSDQPMGGFLLSGEQLLGSNSAQEYELLMTDKKGKSKSYGFILITGVDYKKSYDFTEYLQAGMQINIAFSIDFTSSNGDPRNSNSLHFYSPTVPNAYIRSMLAVSTVVQEYDSDRQFPAYGFGAIAPFTQGTSHFFPLNGNPANAYLNGMQAVVDTYAGLLPQLRLSGPTNFAPTISTVAQGARQAQGVYTILLILTDGAITDMQQTVDAIVASDDAPLSIIIIGVGNADFSSMEQLDGDGGSLHDSRRRTGRRDVVQFVPFRQFAGKDPAMLAAAVLQEVPRQVEKWGRITGKVPGGL